MRIKILYLSIILSSILFLQTPSYAQDYDKPSSDKDTENITSETVNKLRPGMELRKIGGINMVVPKGTQIYKEGSLIRMEEDGDYTARRLEEVDSRFNKLEGRQKKLEEDIQELRKLLTKDQKQ